jgi:hypothetical protein
LSTTLSQPAQMAACIYAGLIMGIFRDALDMLLPTERMWLNAVKDIVFWAGCALLAAGTLFLANGLVVRPFTLACFLFGFLLWRFAATPFVMGIYRFFAAGVRAFFTRFFQLLE